MNLSRTKAAIPAIARNAPTFVGCLLAHDHTACIGLFILLFFSFPRRQEDEEET
ncbi:hypothetical protein YC2023_119030 [Brassica napus]